MTPADITVHMAGSEVRDFAGFRIVRPIEIGERAAVWEAEPLDGAEAPVHVGRVAIETLTGEAAADDDVVEWFTEGWELAAGIEHRNIVSVVRLDEQDGVPYVVRAPAGEMTLADRLERGGPLSAGAALQVMGEVAEALEAAHTAGLVHGALTPAVVSLDEHGHALLAGFGRRLGYRRDDVRDLGELLLAMLGEPAGPDSADGEEGADGEAEEVTSEWERLHADALRAVGAAGASGDFARAEDLLAAAREARPLTAEGERPPGPSGTSIVLGVVALFAVVLIFVLMVGGDDEDSEPAESTPTSAAPADEGAAALVPSTGPSRPIPVRGAPVGIAAAGDSVYAVTKEGASLDGFDQRTGQRILGPIDLGAAAGDIAIAGDFAWVTLPDADSVAQVDLSADQPAPDTYGVGAGPDGIVAAAHSIWVLDEDSRELSRIDQEGGDPETFGLDAAKPSAIAYGDGEIWVADAKGAVFRVDPDAPGKQKRLPVPGEPAALVVTDDGTVWVADAAGGTVVALDPSSGDAVEIAVGGEPSDLAADSERLWVANADGYVSAIELGGQAPETIDLSGAGGSPQALAIGQQVWVATGFGNTLVAVAPAAP